MIGPLLDLPKLPTWFDGSLQNEAGTLECRIQVTVEEQEITH